MNKRNPVIRCPVDIMFLESFINPLVSIKRINLQNRATNFWKGVPQKGYGTPEN